MTNVQAQSTQAVELLGNDVSPEALESFMNNDVRSSCQGLIYGGGCPTFEPKMDGLG